MLRPPSLSKTWDEYVSVDPVFVQPPTIEDKQAYEEYAAKLKAARETGDWTPMLAPGRTLNEATKFTMLQVDRNAWRDLLDRHTLPFETPGRIGPALLRAVLVRLSLSKAYGLDVKIERAHDPQWGLVMAGADVVDYLDSINPRVVGELGTRVLDRLRGVHPLS